MENKFLIANLSWNPHGWKRVYKNRKAGHDYVKKHPAHESLNFEFDKKDVDTEKDVFGYIQWTRNPVNLPDNGIIIFYSNNTDENKGQIVGIYSDVEILKESKVVKWEGFENDILELNIKANKKLSLLFPIPLDADSYKKAENRKRLVGQIGYSYYDISLAEQIVMDQLVELNKSGVQKNEIEKLKKIYRFVAGKEFELDLINADEIEQQELTNILKENDKSELIDDLLNLKEIESETVYVNQKIYKRDNKTIAQLKVLRDFKCQICGTQIRKRNGDFYVEAAHIKPKHKKGRETPDNILILCPNHHKEFDYGDRSVKFHSKDMIKFEMNDVIYEIDLRIG